MAVNSYFDRPMQPLRDEHRELLPYVERLSEVGDAVGEIPLAALRDRIDELDAFLAENLLPRARAEDEVVYPLLASMLGTMEAASMMNRDHIQLSRFTDELAAVRRRLTGPRLRGADAKALRRILYGLSAILQLHLEQEEVYLAMLDTRLAPEKTQTVFQALEDATARFLAAGAQLRAIRGVGERDAQRQGQG